MMNNKDQILLNLSRLGLNRDQAKVYTYLLENGASTHLQIARSTSVNRTKVYRIIDDLEKLSLATVNISDEGKKVLPASPKNLEVVLTAEESKLEAKRAAYSQSINALNSLFKNDNNTLKFKVNTYEGTNGFKQMLWNELKAKGELLGFGSGTIEDLVQSRAWAEKHRQKTLDSGYSIREIVNPGKKKLKFTDNSDFYATFHRRSISDAKLNLEQQTMIYNDTVAIYHWRDDQKVGFEVINKAYADMMRQVFEMYWLQAEELSA